MAFISIHLLIIVVALWTTARNVYEPQQYRRSIQEYQEVQAGNLTDIPLSQIGYTQDSISSDIHNNSAKLVPMQTFVDLARKDPRGPEAYLRGAFPGRLTVFPYPNDGLLSLDNRRLYLFKTLAPNASIPVEIVTAEEAGRSLIRGRKITAQDALKERVTTKNGGKSIEIRKGEGNDSGGGSSGKPPQAPGTSGTQGNATQPGNSTPGSPTGTQRGSKKPGSSKPGGSNPPNKVGSKKQGGSKTSRRPKKRKVLAYIIRR